MKLSRILHIATEKEAFAAQLAELEAAGVTVQRTALGVELIAADCHVEMVSAVGEESAMAMLRDHYVHGVLLDARCAAKGEWAERVKAVHRVLEALDNSDDVEARYGFHRIVALVGERGDTSRWQPSPDEFVAELGARGVRRISRQKRRESGGAFLKRAICDTLTLICGRRLGQTALCSSGGGITGIYFELGALKCLEDALGAGSLQSFDLYYGISAGAVVNSLLAAGYRPGEIMAAVAGHRGGRIPPIDLSLLRLSHLNLPDYARRASAVARSAIRQVGTLARGELRRGLEDAFLEYTALIGPPFRSDRFEDLLRSLLEVDGVGNRFADLERTLLIGATDQDQRSHVVFGAPPLDQVPISRAVQASLSIHPAFASVEIDGRWYEDGAVTRTSGFTEAIRRGADLLFILDPFVPYVSPRPGAISRRGVLYNLDQELRTISFTRFENTQKWVLRKHPEVSSYTFLPSNRSRRLLSRNPMDHRPYLAIWHEAYLSVLRRLEVVAHRLHGDLGARGMTLNLNRPREVAARLEATKKLCLEDFFVGGRLPDSMEQR